MDKNRDCGKNDIVMDNLEIKVFTIKIKSKDYGRNGIQAIMVEIIKIIKMGKLEIKVVTITDKNSDYMRIGSSMDTTQK